MKTIEELEELLILLENYEASKTDDNAKKISEKICQTQKEN